MEKSVGKEAGCFIVQRRGGGGGCVKSFQQYSLFEKQLRCDTHKYALGHEILYDKAMIMYAAKLQKLEHGTGVIPETVDGDVIISLEDKGPALRMGWTLRSAIVTRKNLTATQKTYLSEVFQEKHSGQKTDPVNILKAMRRAKHSDGSIIFEKDDLFAPLQIAGFFSRSTVKTLAALAMKSLQDMSQTQKDIPELTKEASDEDFCSSASNHV